MFTLNAPRGDILDANGNTTTDATTDWDRIDSGVSTARYLAFKTPVESTDSFYPNKKESTHSF